MPKSTKSSSDYAKGIAQLSDYISTLPKYDYGRQAQAALDAEAVIKSKAAQDKSKHGPIRRLSEGIGYGAGMVTSETLSGLEWALEYFNKSSERVDGWQNAVKDFTESTWGDPRGTQVSRCYDWLLSNFFNCTHDCRCGCSSPTRGYRCNRRNNRFSRTWRIYFKGSPETCDYF